MQVSVETTSGLERRMTIEVPEERVETEVQNRLRNLARTTRLKGFRPGKVPLKVVERQYGGQVRQEVIGEVIQSTFSEAVAQEQLQPAGMPDIEPKELEKGKNLQYVATFEVMPQVEVASLEGVAVETPKAEVTDADIDNMLETLRKQQAKWVEADRAADEGDRVTVDFEGTVGGETFQGNKGTDVPVTLGGGRMIPGFEDGLKGLKAGDEKTLEVTFPEDYGSAEVAGKDAKFEVKVKKVEEPELPAIDADFAKALGVNTEDMDEFRAEVRQSMERELKQNLKAQVKQQVMDKLLEVNNIELPQALIEQESQALAQQLQQQMQGAQQGKGAPQLEPSMFADQAKRRVALGLILSELVQSNEIKADPEKVRAAVEEVASTYEQPDEVIKFYYSDQRRLAEVESMVLEDAVVDWVLDNAKVQEKQASFDEIMNRNS